MAKLWAHVTDPPPCRAARVPISVASFDEIVARATAKDPRRALRDRRGARRRRHQHDRGSPELRRARGHPVHPAGTRGPRRRARLCRPLRPRLASTTCSSRSRLRRNARLRRSRPRRSRSAAPPSGRVRRSTWSFGGGSAGAAGAKAAQPLLAARDRGGRDRRARRRGVRAARQRRLMTTVGRSRRLRWSRPSCPRTWPGSRSPARRSSASMRRTPGWARSSG